MFNRLREEFGISRDLLVLSLARLADAFGNGLLIITIPLYLNSFDVSTNIPLILVTGVVLASYGLSSSVFQPIFGKATDKLEKRKPFLVLGLIAVALVTYSFTFVNSFKTLLTANVLRGIAVAVTLPATMALVAEITEKRTRGGSMGIYTTMRMAGFALAPLISGILIETVGLSIVFVLGGSVALVGSMLVQVFVSEPDSENTQSNSPDPEFGSIPNDLYVLGFAMFLMATSISLITTLEPQFNERLSQTAIGFSIAFSSLMVTRLITQAPIGRFSDRKGRKPFILLGMLVMGILTVFLPYVKSTAELTILRLGQGIASAGIAAPGFAMAADLSSERKGEEMGVLTTSFMLGLAAGPLISGLLASYVSFSSPFLFVGILTVTGGLIFQYYVSETV